MKGNTSTGVLIGILIAMIVAAAAFIYWQQKTFSAEMAALRSTIEDLKHPSAPAPGSATSTPTSTAPSFTTLPAKLVPLPGGKEAPATAYDYETDGNGTVRFYLNGKATFTMQADAARALIQAANVSNPRGIAVALGQDPSLLYLAQPRSMYVASGALVSVETSVFSYATGSGRLIKIYADSNAQGDALVLKSGVGSKLDFTRCNIDWSPGPGESASACPPGTRWTLDVNDIGAGLRPS